MVDDCSTDDTLEIARNCAKGKPQIRIETNPRNLGLVGNWNQCVRMARGEWIKFVFQDDWIAPNCLDRMVSAIKRGTMAIACRREFSFDDDTPESTRSWYLNLLSVDLLFPGQTEISASEYREATLDNIGANFVGEPTALMLHRSVFDRFGAFNEDLIMMCDSEYWARVAIHTGLTYVPETLATFRVHKQSTSATNFSVRRYRMDLDELVLMHHFLFDPVYEPLRVAASRRQPPMDLVGTLIDRARGARWLAVDAAHRKESPNPLQLKQWRELAIRYPRLSRFADGRRSLVDLGALRRSIQRLFRRPHHERT